MGRAKTILIYTKSGGTKTTQCVHLARYVWKKFGKRTRLISGDGGGWKPVEDERIDPTNPNSPFLIKSAKNPEGIVDVINITNRPHLLADMRRLSRGAWLYKVKGKDGQAEERWLDWATRGEKDNIGAIFIEGLTSIATGFLNHISKQDNRAGSVGKVMYAAPNYEEDGEIFGGTDQGHVGMVQNETWNLCQQFGTLPVEVVVWTALEEKGEVKNTSATIYGPKLAGNAKTYEAPSWFSDCLHFQEMSGTVDLGGGILTQTKKVFAFYAKHTDPDTGNFYICKVSVGPSLYKRLEEKWPGGCFEMGLDKGMVEYLEFMDKIRGEEGI